MNQGSANFIKVQYETAYYIILYVVRCTVRTKPMVRNWIVHKHKSSICFKLSKTIFTEANTFKNLFNKITLCHHMVFLFILEVHHNRRYFTALSWQTETYKLLFTGFVLYKTYGNQNNVLIKVFSRKIGSDKIAP